MNTQPFQYRVKLYHYYAKIEKLHCNLMINVQFYLNIQGKAQINAQNQQGLSPLHLAANQGYDKLAEILIENGN